MFNVARSLPPPAITLATTQPVREFISSGEAEQTVSDDGTFRKLFLDVLTGREPDADANHDGYVTGTELGLFLHQKMTNLTNNRQTPRYGKLNAYGYDRGDFVFQVDKPDVPATAAVPIPQPTSEAAQAWAAAQRNTSQAVLEDFIQRYGNTFYGTLARARLEELKKANAVVADPVERTFSFSKLAKSSEKRRVPPNALPQDPIGIGPSKDFNDFAQKLDSKSKTPLEMAVVSPPISAPTGPCASGVIAVSLSSRAAKPLSAIEECSLEPKDVFKECDKCPEIVVVPSGSFTMGSPKSEPERLDNEEAQVRVTIPKPFAVGKFAVTFDEWDACVADGGCGDYKPDDAGWGRGRRPVIMVSWNDAQKYVSWISNKTGKTYRLLWRRNASM